MEEMPYPDGVSFEFLFGSSATIPGDPACDDLGAIVAAACRHAAVRMETAVYGSVWLRAAAIMVTLIRLRPLERDNLVYGLVAAASYLAVNEIALDYGDETAWRLANAIESYNVDVAQAAAILKSWGRAS